MNPITSVVEVSGEDSHNEVMNSNSDSASVNNNEIKDISASVNQIPVSIKNLAPNLFSPYYPPEISSNIPVIGYQNSQSTFASSALHSTASEDWSVPISNNHSKCTFAKVSIGESNECTSSLDGPNSTIHKKDDSISDVDIPQVTNISSSSPIFHSNNPIYNKHAHAHLDYNNNSVQTKLGIPTVTHTQVLSSSRHSLSLSSKHPSFSCTYPSSAVDTHKHSNSYSFSTTSPIHTPCYYAKNSLNFRAPQTHTFAPNHQRFNAQSRRQDRRHSTTGAVYTSYFINDPSGSFIESDYYKHPSSPLYSRAPDFSYLDTRKALGGTLPQPNSRDYHSEYNFIQPTTMNRTTMTTIGSKPKSPPINTSIHISDGLKSPDPDPTGSLAFSSLKCCASPEPSDTLSTSDSNIFRHYSLSHLSDLDINSTLWKHQSIAKQDLLMPISPVDTSWPTTFDDLAIFKNHNAASAPITAAHSSTSSDEDSRRTSTSSYLLNTKDDELYRPGGLVPPRKPSKLLMSIASSSSEEESQDGPTSLGSSLEDGFSLRRSSQKDQALNTQDKWRIVGSPATTAASNPKSASIEFSPSLQEKSGSMIMPTARHQGFTSVPVSRSSTPEHSNTLAIPTHLHLNARSESAGPPARDDSNIDSSNDPNRLFTPFLSSKTVQSSNAFSILGELTSSTGRLVLDENIEFDPSWSFSSANEKSFIPSNQVMFSSIEDEYSRIRSYSDPNRHRINQSSNTNMMMDPSMLQHRIRTKSTLSAQAAPFFKSESTNPTLSNAKYKGPLYIVEFKSGRAEIFYVPNNVDNHSDSEERDYTDQDITDKNSIEDFYKYQQRMERLISKGSKLPDGSVVALNDWVIVEADRGEDLGRVSGIVTMEWLQAQMLYMAAHPAKQSLLSMDGSDGESNTIDPASVAMMFPSASLGGTADIEDLRRIAFQTGCVFMPSNIKNSDSNNLESHIGYQPSFLSAKELVPKRIHRRATMMDLRSLASKSQEEAIAVLRCTSRVRARRLPMEIVDAEYQWDRNKLTFYFKSDSRIDFRELVRELFRIYKTRIWMCAVERRMGDLLCTFESD